MNEPFSRHRLTTDGAEASIDGFIFSPFKRIDGRRWPNWGQLHARWTIEHALLPLAYENSTLVEWA